MDVCTILAKSNGEEGVYWHCVKICHSDKMDNTIYDIVMKTPIGLRYGTISLCSNGSNLNGTLDLLEHSEPFDGTIDNDGNCTICGHIVTLMRTIHYTAVGKVSESSIELSIQGERNIFRITGVAAGEREVHD